MSLSSSPSSTMRGISSPSTMSCPSRARQEKEILCQGRGSAANSAVCYCLGITSVNPEKTKLLFARFISENRGEPPDIDVDFEHERREEVIQYIYQRYGRDRAAICSTVVHYRSRRAIREVGKVLGLTEDVTAALAKTVWGYGDGLPDAHIRQAGLDPFNPAIRQAVHLADDLIGFPRHLSQHVGGFVLTRAPLDETVPIGNAAMEDRTFIEWDKDDIDTLGLMKVDVLALGMLSCLRRGLDLLQQHYGKTYSLATLPQDDAAVYEMLSRANSVGVFQVESRAQMSMLPRLKPKCFYDLVIEVAIVRPGPIQGDMVHPYLRRRDGIEKEHYPSPDPAHGAADELKDVLQRTLGVPLFQEQAMQIAITAAKFTPDEADGLRRAMATFRHTGNVHLFRDKFIDGMTTRGYERAFAENCFGQIEGFGEYGFPESHAASFALLVYASAWIKCRYPDVFCAAIVNSQPMGFYQPAQLVRDARQHDVEIRPADVNFSDWDCTLEPGAGGRLRRPARLPPHSGAQRRRAEKTHRGARQRLFQHRAAGRIRRYFALHHRAAGRSGCIPFAGTGSPRRIMGSATARRDWCPSAAPAGCRHGRGRIAAVDAASERRTVSRTLGHASGNGAQRARRGGLRGDRVVAERASGALFPRTPHRARRHAQRRASQR